MIPPNSPNIHMFPPSAIHFPQSPSSQKSRPFHPFPEDVESSYPSLRSLSSPSMMTDPLSKSPLTFSSPAPYPPSSSASPVAEESAKELETSNHTLISSPLKLLLRRRL
ncbi:hypothetical protein HanRHA438_Chr13g0597711 [Helianthus annuus]|uniref:Uncharacterized protein n=1 Tax=Helianthus annuus TaxID=4232 RepID=A0A251SV32_HELAN|nr:hypothetical protein HanXRQr2_Chr13g0587051 [Helianthus annuus]KAJ0481137.1 hypothetical protein HanIR_Chr13g0639291 [Helianthus annuus]KAJ0849120.1 hypothetical protein HanPSC8_Chr13g0565261 [Helianthus annuus]KAJ0858127.1 hypothetical protein HanRHA438_Chr13g0597711 [Helianthus annuus]